MVSVGVVKERGNGIVKRAQNRFSTKCPGCQKPLSGTVTVTYSLKPAGVLADGPVSKVSL